ncbi:uncharacterized protein VTP21DRAFT_529 [Calcarisporiella thermophila]|uniref:uncharacterized protein n=1 Tax=Calcarisporiella thermophila TaxID=911321 RepID=UPI00374422CE
MLEREKSSSDTIGAARTIVPKNVILKLISFTLAIIFGPLLTYYYTLQSVFSGNSTYAAISAIIVANILLVLYIIVAVWEDKEDLSTKKAKKQN